MLGDGIVVKEEVGICEEGLGKVDSTRVVESTFGVLEVSVLADDVDMVLELSTGYVSVVGAESSVVSALVDDDILSVDCIIAVVNSEDVVFSVVIGVVVDACMVVGVVATVVVVIDAAVAVVAVVVAVVVIVVVVVEVVVDVVVVVITCSHKSP